MQPADRAVEFCCDRCFHQSLWLPASSTRDALRVSYATTRNFQAEDASKLPTVLYCLPMGASRLTMVYEMDHTAIQAGVKMIFIDRPGFGGSTRASLEDRIDLWIEAVSAVLAKLQITHVALVAHSVGTLYLMNTIARLPHVLHPRSPYVAVQAPWVHPSNSGMAVISVAEKLPKSWIGNFDKLVTLFDKTLGTLTTASGVALRSMGSSHVAKEGSEPSESQHVFGFIDEEWREVTDLKLRFLRAEDRSGMSQDTLLCLRKGNVPWGTYDDLPACIATLCEEEKKRISTMEQQEPPEAWQKMKFRVNFSETDALIGSGGRRYFENCWKHESVAGVIDFTSAMIPRATHDTIFSPLHELGLPTILREVRTSFGLAALVDGRSS